MPNTHVFTGLDGTISVAVETGAEGDAAKAVNDTYSLTPIGRATGVTVAGRVRHEAVPRAGPALRDRAAPRQHQRHGHDRPRARQRRAAAS